MAHILLKGLLIFKKSTLFGSTVVFKTKINTTFMKCVGIMAYKISILIPYLLMKLVPLNYSTTGKAAKNNRLKLNPYGNS